MSAVVNEHRTYLSDPIRGACYERAIAEVVQPGDVVVDLGCGTGILGLLACRAGAARVYAIEQTSLIGLAREISRRNGVSDRMTFLRGCSLQIELPERVDVVLADQMGPFGIDAGILDYFGDARVRFLKPGGTSIPSELELSVAPIESQEISDDVQFWESSPLGFDLRSVQGLAINSGYYLTVTSDNVLGEPVVLGSMDPSAPLDPTFVARGSSIVQRPGVLHGLGTWFKAQLSPSVVMSNSPLASDRISRSNLFYPVGKPVQVEPGDRVDIEVRIALNVFIVSWDVTVWAAGSQNGSPKSSFRHSTFEGLMLSREDMNRTRPDSRPQLDRRGLARRTVLNLCDGSRTLAEIEVELRSAHPTLFPTQAEASSFASEVVTRYSL